MKFQVNEFIKTKGNEVYCIYGTVNEDSIPMYRLRYINFQKPTIDKALLGPLPGTFPCTIADNEWTSLGFSFEAAKILYSK